VVASASVVASGAVVSTGGIFSAVVSAPPSAGVQATIEAVSIASRSAIAVSLIIAFFFIAISFQNIR
jgi:hypothetical protein